MSMRGFPSTALLCLALTAGTAAAEERPTYQVPATGVSLATGDSWSYGGQHFQLFGVQACLRGTFFTNAAGQKTDCGEASIAYLAAVLKDTHPTCFPVGQLTTQGEASTIVVCAAKVGSSTRMSARS
jgi:endonuclease YncB( thermonuclease family)